MKYRQHRYPTQFPINIRTPSGPQRAEIIDVNHDGARLNGLSRLRRGEKVQLDVLSHRIDAIVLWVSQTQVGITFRPKINDHQVDTLRQRRGARAGVHRGSVGFAAHTML